MVLHSIHIQEMFGLVALPVHLALQVEHGMAVPGALMAEWEG